MRPLNAPSRRKRVILPASRFKISQPSPSTARHSSPSPPSEAAASRRPPSLIAVFAPNTKSVSVGDVLASSSLCCHSASIFLACQANVRAAFSRAAVTRSFSASAASAGSLASAASRSATWCADAAGSCSAQAEAVSPVPRPVRPWPNCFSALRVTLYAAGGGVSAAAAGVIDRRVLSNT
jgi:hypothetical protein